MPIIKGKVWEVRLARADTKICVIRKGTRGDHNYKLAGWTRWSNSHPSLKAAIEKALEAHEKRYMTLTKR